MEGASDRIALVTLARRRDLEPPEVIVLGGAHAVGSYVRQAPHHAGLVGLCDAKEAPIFRRVLARVHVCDPDLEGELIRALGVDRVQRIIDSEGELASFRTLQRQPAQRARPIEAQLGRFIGGRSGNKERYARLFVEALDLDRVPAPLNLIFGRTSRCAPGSPPLGRAGAGAVDPAGEVEPGPVSHDETRGSD